MLNRGVMTLNCIRVLEARNYRDAAPSYRKEIEAAMDETYQAYLDEVPIEGYVIADVVPRMVTARDDDLPC